MGQAVVEEELLLGMVVANRLVEIVENRKESEDAVFQAAAPALSPSQTDDGFPSVMAAE